MEYGKGDNESLGAATADAKELKRIESEAEEELDRYSQEAVDAALLTVAEEYLENFAETFVTSIIKNTNKETDGANLEKLKQRSTDEGSFKIEHESGSITEKNVNLLSPVDYTSLCVPKDYCIFGNYGNRLDETTKEDREAVLLKRGVWPSDEAIEYQFSFVEMMKAFEIKRETEADCNFTPLSTSRRRDVYNDDESDSEFLDQNDEILTINFEVGPSTINRYPDKSSHYPSNDTVDDVLGNLEEDDGKHSTKPIPSPPHTGKKWDRIPRSNSAYELLSAHHRRECASPPPPHPSHPNSQNENIKAFYPTIAGPTEVRPHMMMRQTRRDSRDRKRYESRPGCPHQWRYRRYHESTAQSNYRVPPPHYSNSSYRSGQRFVGGYDRRNSYHQNHEQYYNHQESPPIERNHQVRPRPSRIHYNPSRQSAAHYDPTPSTYRQRDRWDTSICQHGQLHIYQQEWDRSVHPHDHFQPSYEPNFHRHHNFRDSINRQQR
ncbi:uncharacterized protein LOC121427729 isoform X2 [Lytechinus variegatus]|uniref:uncharacterized protein LOC121427729 isoform X2 n=1 Tax=Lytechinus variegatus TaxID=7654 RepID=UPI001BB24C72|nr:uncharacterized protein LOC121427729 isoform X2 [Lytechinus variegatus]